MNSGGQLWLRWSIGHSASGEGCLDRKPHKAHLVWRDAREQIVRSGEFAEDGILREIANAEERGDDAKLLREALQDLKNGAARVQGRIGRPLDQRPEPQVALS